MERIQRRLDVVVQSFDADAAQNDNEDSDDEGGVDDDTPLDVLLDEVLAGDPPIYLVSPCPSSPL